MRFINEKLMIAYLAMMTNGLFADSGAESVIIGSGNDVGDELSVLQSIVKTSQGFILSMLAPLAGTWLVYSGIKMIGNSERGDKTPGVITTVSGILLFIFPKVIQNFVSAFSS